MNRIKRAYSDKEGGNGRSSNRIDLSANSFAGNFVGASKRDGIKLPRPVLSKFRKAAEIGDNPSQTHSKIIHCQIQESPSSVI